MLEHRTFVRFAALFEAALVVVAIVIAQLTGVTPTVMAAGAGTWLIGVIATLPLIALYYVLASVPFGPLQKIHTLLLATLGRPLSQCRWHELALLALLAGVCEEFLFRGVLQPWLEQWGTTTGWVGTNLIFGLAHAVTPTYFVLAAAIGAYFSGLQWYAGGLVAPILAHSLYDWFAFVQIARAYRRSQSGEDEQDERGTFGKEG